MNLTESYLANNGYDYYGNAAEDTLLFFVRDIDAPLAEPSEENENDAITNMLENMLNRNSMNPRAHAEADDKKGTDSATDFDISRDIITADSKYNNEPAIDSVVKSDSKAENKDTSSSIPKMAESNLK